MKLADIQKGHFYIGGKRQRIREVLERTRFGSNGATSIPKPWTS
jgi:hypothetical protein